MSQKFITSEEIELPPNLRLVIQRARVRMEILESGSDPRARFELFQRLNTGGSPLSEQEVRTSISLKLHSFLDDVGNMKHELLIACMKCVGLGIDYFENLEQFVDKDLIKQRNEIAHGRHTTITASDAVDIIGKVIEIITRLKNDIIQGAETKKYLIGQ
ncbi:MAG: MAE_28990/MAE_18760 family HEPN-like nuclease [Alphaproteobacteria bacterium]|nr:MAE_28990/MAE_18760 family HEPN-like nuclease [Alphaproteobacteria bacterium]